MLSEIAKDDFCRILLSEYDPFYSKPNDPILSFAEIKSWVEGNLVRLSTEPSLSFKLLKVEVEKF